MNSKNKKISENAQEIIYDRLETIKTESESLLCLCESPVEQIFLAAAIDYFGLIYNDHEKRGQAPFSAEYPAADGIFTILVEPQREIVSLDAKYRADFFFSLYRFASGGHPNLWGKTVVEIDGHDFHEKTKQQASRDKKRDRDLLAMDIFTLRFSGSDVYNDPSGSVESLSFHMDKCAHDVLKSFEDRGALSDLLWGKLK